MILCRGHSRSYILFSQCHHHLAVRLQSTPAELVMGTDYYLVQMSEWDNHRLLHIANLAQTLWRWWWWWCSSESLHWGKVKRSLKVCVRVKHGKRKPLLSPPLWTGNLPELHWLHQWTPCSVAGRVHVHTQIHTHTHTGTLKIIVDKFIEQHIFYEDWCKRGRRSDAVRHEQRDRKTIRRQITIQSQLWLM